MTISKPMPWWGTLRLLLYYFSLPITKLMATIIMPRISHNVRVNIEALTLVGPKEVVGEAVDVLSDLRNSCPDLYNALTGTTSPILCYYPMADKSMSYMRYFFVGQDYLVWGKTGILTHMAWTAFKIKAQLHHPSVSFRDYYDGENQMKKASLEMMSWLQDNNQPAELIQTFRKMYTADEI